MKIIVQKFGGTSVASEEARIAVKDKVQQAIRNGFAPVVVVSAMGRKGAPYATDTLIDTLKEANISVNVREMDLLMCCGEIISSCVMAATLQKYGINAMALTGGQAGINVGRKALGSSVAHNGPEVGGSVLNRAHGRSGNRQLGANARGGPNNVPHNHRGL